MSSATRKMPQEHSKNPQNTIFFKCNNKTCLRVHINILFTNVFTFILYFFYCFHLWVLNKPLNHKLCGGVVKLKHSSIGSSYRTCLHTNRSNTFSCRSHAKMYQKSTDGHVRSETGRWELMIEHYAKAPEHNKKNCASIADVSIWTDSSIKINHAHCVGPLFYFMWAEKTTSRSHSEICVLKEGIKSNKVKFSDTFIYQTLKNY